MTVLVSVDLPGVLGQEVTAWAEVEAGWQVIGGEGPPAPALTLASGVVADRACVVVVQGVPAPEQVREALLAGALDVVAWPTERERLRAVPLRVAAPVPAAGGPVVLPVAGLAGGAGASTVALAVGGVLAWAGRRTIVVGDEDLLALCGLGGWEGPGAGDLAALDPAATALEVPGLVRPVPGLDRLSVLGGDARRVATCAGWPADTVVLDLRTPAPGAPLAPGLLVARADASLRRPRRVPPGWRVLVLGIGPFDRATVHRLLGAHPTAWLPASDRVARAGASGRTPSALPGSWLATLRTTLLGPPR
jgi:hypothetical protein